MLRIAAGKLLIPHKTTQIAFYSDKAGACAKDKIAVVLSGCGFLDGSEIHEAVNVLAGITRNGAIPVMFAPDCPMKEVIDHVTGKPTKGQLRGVLEESARIARGKIHPLADLTKPKLASMFNAVIFPGGFGVVKVLSDFAEKGINCTVHPEVVTVLESFHKERKPIGLVCVAPILAARVLCQVTITLGKDSCEWPYRDVITAAKKMGAILESREYNEVSYDAKNQIFSVPAYMYEGAKFHEIGDAVQSFVKYLIMNMRKGEKPKKENLK